jgi:RNA polymerase sigma factor (sigma-70 family)
MAATPVSPVVRYVRQLAAAHLAEAVPDEQLLERYARRRDEAAFAALVRRHGPLVLGACRRVLRDGHAAEDVFQATFVVLARKAAAAQRPRALGPWLYGVATRTALKVRGRDARRRTAERQAAVADGAADAPDGLLWRDLRPVLDEAVAALPEHFRVPFVLHHLEGATVAEVARRLGCPQGTVAARLARAKERLRGRLAHRGLTASAAALTALLSQQAAPAGVPAALVVSTATAATVAAGPQVIGAATAAALTQGGVQAMFLTKVKVTAALLLVAGVAWAGVGWFGPATAGGGPVAVAEERAVANGGQGVTPKAAPRGGAGVKRLNDDANASDFRRSTAAQPIPAGGWADENPPDRAAILRALPKVKGVPYVYEESRDDLEFTVEKVSDQVAEPRYYPLIGPARLRTSHYKCTVYFTETIQSSYPFPFQSKRRRVVTVFIDRDQLVVDAAPNVPDGEGQPATPPAQVIGPPDVLRIETEEGLLPQPLFGPHLVRPDGTVGLGTYGAAYVAGLTADQAREVIAHVLHAGLDAEEVALEAVREGLRVDVLVSNSKVYYVIAERVGFGEVVIRFPLTNNETVLDALAQVADLHPIGSKRRVWVARPGVQGGADQVLPVDWAAITQRGETLTNYQLLPGDRVHVAPQDR